MLLLQTVSRAIIPRRWSISTYHTLGHQVVAMDSGAVELLSAQHKRDFFDEIEELLRLPKHRRPKPDTVENRISRPSASSSGTRRQPVDSTNFTEKERLATEEEPADRAVEAEAEVATMRDLKKLGALQPEKRPAERKPKASAAKKAKRGAVAAPVDPNTQLLHDKRVLVIPFGPDMGRKRVEILKNMVEKLGGSVLDKSFKATGRAGAAVQVNWDQVSLVIASSQLSGDKAAEFLHVDKFPPPSVEVYTPEWLVHLRQKKAFPPGGLMLTWTEQQQFQEEVAKHEQHCEEVVQQLEEKRAAGASDSDEGSNSDNSDKREIERAPPVQIDSQEVRQQQAELNEKNRKLVEERTPIFYKNNPGFRPINETAVPGSKKIKGDGFICQRSSGTSAVVVMAHGIGTTDNLLTFWNLLISQRFSKISTRI
jgi:hypothetical protein